MSIVKTSNIIYDKKNWENERAFEAKTLDYKIIKLKYHRARIRSIDWKEQQGNWLLTYDCICYGSFIKRLDFFQALFCPNIPDPQRSVLRARYLKKGRRNDREKKKKPNKVKIVRER